MPGDAKCQGLATRRHSGEDFYFTAAYIWPLRHTIQLYITNETVSTVYSLQRLLPYAFSPCIIFSSSSALFGACILPSLRHIIIASRLHPVRESKLHHNSGSAIGVLEYNTAGRLSLKSKHTTTRFSSTRICAQTANNHMFSASYPALVVSAFWNAWNDFTLASKIIQTLTGI